MRENIYFYFVHTHVLFILSLVFLWFNTTTATSFGYQLVAAAGGADNTCIDKERQALLDFKDHLHDPDGWLSTWRPEADDCCEWSGVACDTQTGHVTELGLNGYGLGGEISLLLLNLTYLNHLDLSFNSFHGTIPMFIGFMTHFTYLNLGQNQFTGTIPKFIGNMTRLTYLDLSSNQLSGTIPESIGNMTRLTYLDLSSNQFSGTIPESISNVTQLTHLELYRNTFSGTIPISIGSLTNLTELLLRGNNFTGTIPDSIGSLTSLTYLDLGENNFNGIIPRSIGYLTKLEVLYLSDNSFYGTIPTEFGNLTNLESLSLSNLTSCTVDNLDWLSFLSNLKGLFMDGTSLAKVNNWVNVIIGLQNLEELNLVGCDLSQVMHPYSSSVNSSSSIHELYLDNNNLNSSMYRWWCPLIGNKLGSLTISGNTFDGKLSDFLNNLSGCTSATMLENLYASSSQFTGSLSDKIQHFSSLERLNLSSNQLDGTISDKLWQLPNLQTLDLSSNSLRGTISESIGKSNLSYINLSYNSLEGAPSNDDVSNLSQSIHYIDFSSNKLGPRFPKWIHKLQTLIHLDLSGNNISETVSTKYWNEWQSSDLIYLDLSFNNISGTILNVHFNLLVLDLSKNKLSGDIYFLCQMGIDLSFLDISDNSFAGQIPDCLWLFEELVVLNLANNNLSGRIPPTIEPLIKLEALYLYNNNLFGELPSSLKHCTNLTFLNLGVNKFSGNVPVWIGENLSRLYVLSLASNNFYGTIPSQLCHLVNLQLLDLSMNNLHGTIPSCINDITAMVLDIISLKETSDLVTVNSLAIRHIHRAKDTSSYNYYDYVMVRWQGKVREFSRNLESLKSIDLSSNRLTGQIPYELTNLYQLVALNLSKNALLGEIPRQIGEMKELEILDLSKNNFSGGLPLSMSQMHFLSYLDVSHNNLSGRIPSCTQLQTFDPSRYTGNAGLCGSPLPNKCPGDEELDEPHTIGKSQGDEEGIERWFYIGGASGFATGFWIVCSALLLNRRWRHAFFQFHDSLKDWVYVNVVVFIAKWQRVSRA